MKPLDKKQIPQVIVLAVVAVAFFAYFALKLILPTPAAAKTGPGVTLAATPTPAAGTPVVPVPAVAADAALTAPPPGPGMRDPFVPAILDAATQPPAPAPAARTVSTKGPSETHPFSVAPLPIPSVQALPFPPAVSAGPANGRKNRAAGLAPLAVAPPPPAWVVTGVLQSGPVHIAILRDGEARRFVKQGDFVDGEYKVVLVTRQTVILGHGAIRFVLPLGGAKPASAKSGIAVPSAPPLPIAPKPDAISRAFVPASAASMARLPQRIFEPRITVALRVLKPRVAPVAHVRLVVPDLLVAATPLPATKPAAKKPAAKRLAARFGANPTVRVADYISTGLLDNAPSVTPRGMLSPGTFAPDFSLSTIDGQTMTLSQFQGHPVLLNFWASWDVQSTHMMSTLASLQGEFQDQGLAVLSVNSWDNEQSLRGFLNGRDFGGVVMLFDPSVSNDSLAVRLYKVPDVPALYLIDSEGRIAAAFVGHGHNTSSAIKAALARIGVR